MSDSKQKATCWSITVNNPTEADYTQSLPAGWSLTGQLEKGAEGTIHYQGMLKTTQCRFSQVKKLFPRAHIEVAKNKAALSKYVHKDDTRVASVADNNSNVPTLFDFQHTIAAEWDDVDFAVFQEQPQYDQAYLAKYGMGEIAMDYVDSLVAKHIENGVCGIEYIAINPMWRSAWRKFWKQMVARERYAQIKLSGQDIECPSSAESSPPALNSSAENVSLDL